MRPLIWLVGAFACGVVVSVLAVTHSHAPVAGFDLRLAAWVGETLPSWVEWIARPISGLGGGVGLAVFGLAFAAVRLRRRRFMEAWLVVGTYIVVQSVTQATKLVVDRPRPSFDPAISLPSTAAYPSGHSSTATAVLLVVAVLHGRRWSLVVAVVLAVAVGLSRIALGVHWGSDVVGGWALGGCCAAVAVDILHRHRARIP